MSGARSSHTSTVVAPPCGRSCRPSTTLPEGVEQVTGDVTDAGSLAPAVDGVDAVIHLVALLDGSQAQCEAVNHQGAVNVIDAARSAGVRRLVHMSAAGVTEEHAPLTKYWGTKYAAKQAAMRSGLDWTVMEPSFVFGRRGGALKTFEALLRGPVAPVIGDGRYQHQPVWVGDVAAAFAAALDRPETVGKTYELGGPQAFAFNDLLDELAVVTGKPKRRKLHAPVGLMKVQASLLQYFPPPLKVTRDQSSCWSRGPPATSSRCAWIWASSPPRSPTPTTARRTFSGGLGDRRIHC